MKDGWKSQKFTKKARNWDYYAQLKIKILRNIDACESEDHNDICDSCDCWKQTRANCS